jgi:hypothetical protein
MNFFRNFFFFWILILVSQACSKQECDIQAQPLMKVKIVKLKKEGNRFVETADTLLFDEIFGIRAGKPDSTLYEDTTKAKKGLKITSSNLLLFPLSPAQNQSKFVIRFHSGNTDTLAVKYQRRNVLLSEICGFATYFDSLADIKSKMLYKEIYKEIDSVRIETSSVNQNGQVTHVKLYFY